MSHVQQQEVPDTNATEAQITLRSLRIEAYRGMVNVHLEGLKRFNLVVGSNNAGKSSILEAASLVLRPFDPSQWVKVARQRDMDLHLVDGLWSLFPDGALLQLDDGPKQSKKLTIEGDIEGTRRRLFATGLARVSWITDETEDLVLSVEANVSEGSTKPVKHTMEFQRNELAKFSNQIYYHRCFTITPATHRSTRQLVDYMSKAIDEGQKTLAVQLLQLFDSDVIDLDISASFGRDRICLNHRQRGVVDLASFGDGMRRAAALALALVRADKGVLLIDEIEAGIHPTILPRVIAALLEAAERVGVQIIATTHSLEAIDAVVTSIPKDDDSCAGFYLYRRNGQSLVKRYDQMEMNSLRESGVDLR